MTNFYQNKRGIIIIGVVCAAALIGFLIVSDIAKREATSKRTINNVLLNEYNADTLLKYKTSYVGDNSKVVNLISNLPFASYRKEVSLKTDSKPYEISVKYDFVDVSLSIESIKTSLRNNAIVMFALIDNVDVIDFNFGTGIEQNCQFIREQLQQNYSLDFKQYAKDAETLNTLLNSFSLTLFAYPEKYAMTMSSIPGIRLSAEYSGIADMVQYSTTFGVLSHWDNTTGKINTYGQKAELPFATPVYWSPLSNSPFKDADKNSVKVSILNKNVLVAEKQMNIRFDGTMYFVVDTIEGENKETSQNQVISKHLNQVDFSELNKIGIIRVISDKVQRKYVEKDEKYNASENNLKMFRDLIAKAKVNECIQLDRSTGEYKLNLYFKDGKKLTAYYWIEPNENNFSINGIIGEITLDRTIMNELITKITGESIEKPNDNPYSEKN